MTPLAPDVSLLDALAAAAVAAPEEEAVLLAAAMVPLVLESAPHGRALRLVIPALVAGAAELVEFLIEDGERDLMRLLPLILQRTAGTLERAAAQGRVIKRCLAGDVLAGQAAAVINRHRAARDEARRGRRRPDNRRPDVPSARPARPRPPGSRRQEDAWSQAGPWSPESSWSEPDRWLEDEWDDSHDDGYR